MNKRILYLLTSSIFLMTGCNKPQPSPQPSYVNVVLDGANVVLVNDSECYTSFQHNTSEKLERTFKIKDEYKDNIFSMPPNIEVFTVDGKLIEGQDYKYNLLDDGNSANFTMENITKDIRVLVEPFIKSSYFVANLHQEGTTPCKLAFSSKVNGVAKLHYENKDVVIESGVTTFEVANPAAEFEFSITGDVDEINFNDPNISDREIIANNHKIQNILFSSYVKTIPENAFKDFTALIEVHGGYKLNKICANAFYGDYHLNSFDFNIAKRVEVIGDSAFNCKEKNYELSTIDLREYDFVPTLGKDVFCTAPNDFKIIINKDIIDQFKKAENWSDYKDKMVTPSNK